MRLAGLVVAALAATATAVGAGGAWTQGPLPDLWLWQFDLDPELPNPGVLVKLRALVFTQHIETVEDVVVRFYVDGVAVDEAVVDLPVGPTTVTGSWRAVDGVHAVEVVVDPDDLIDETVEDNNARSANADVAPRPDLVLLDVAWTPEQVGQGDVVRFTATVANRGLKGTAAGEANVSFVLSEWKDLQPLGPLAPGATATATSAPWVATVDLLGLLGPRQATILAVAHTDEESRGADNAREETFLVQPGPPVDVRTSGDARGIVAVSADGGATGGVAVAPREAHGTALAVSAGEATARSAAVSATGTAWSTDVAASGTGLARAVWAVSLAGDAEGCADRPLCAVVAPLGDAHGRNPVSLTGDCSAGVVAPRPCFHVVPDGDAEGFYAAAAPAGSARAIFVAAGMEGAESDGGPFSLSAAGTGPARATHTAVSLLGDARGGLAVSLTGDAEGESAVSLTGHADGRRFAISGCDLAGACLDPA